MSFKYFTSESVTEGHPDKICDQISDGILDAILEKDPEGRVACETFITTGLVVVGGEISTSSYVDIQSIVRETIREIGYTRAKFGFDCDTCGVIVTLDEQSKDIALGVDSSLEYKSGEKNATSVLGAGDQGMMFGYACDESEDFMPLTISYAHKLAKRLSEVRKNGTLKYLRPDGKTQVTIAFENGVPKFVDTVVVSSQHDADVSMEQLRADILNHVIKYVIPEDMLLEKTKYHINPTGRFVIGGPNGDTGLTGRKIIVDTYGGVSAHGGGAFSGKDPTKVDRSGAYGARHVAKNLVAAKVASKCEVQLAYAIGKAEPISINVNTFGTGIMDDEEICNLVKEVFTLTPAAIIRNFDLQKPIYKAVAAYGHFGRNELNLPWEKLDKVEEIKLKIQK